MTALKKVTRIAFRRDPEPGKRGERGAAVRQGKFVTGVEYQSGAEGEDYIDYVYYDGVWYKCLITHTPTGDQNPFDDIGHGIDTWAVVPKFSSIATECVIVGDDGNGWFLTEGKIFHTSGKVILTSDGSANFNDKCIITADGEITAKNGVFSGRLQLMFQEIQNQHTLTTSDSSSIWLRGYYGDAVLILPDNDEFDGWMLNIFCYPRIARKDGDNYIQGKIWCPHKTTGSPGDLSTYYASQLFMSMGGFVQLMYSSSAGWILINDCTGGIEYTEYEF